MNSEDKANPTHWGRRLVRGGPAPFESAIVQREGEMVLQPMWCIAQTAYVCRALSPGTGPRQGAFQ